MEQFAIYLWSISENVQDLLIVLGLITAIVGPLITCALTLADSDEFPKKVCLDV